jgi:hypothetical protein
MFDSKVPLGEDTFKKVCTQLISALNDVRVQKSTYSTLSAIWNRKSLNTFIGQVKASDVVIESDDIEFYDWSLHNSCAHFWSCDDIGKCPMLKLAIERAIKKSSHYNLAGNLFNVVHEIHKHQFVGFVSSYTNSNMLTLFHLHSFVTFYTDSASNTVVTFTLTTRHHILSNMQDRLTQLLQLMQFWKVESFAVSLTSKVIGSDVNINQDSIDGYEGLGFDISTFNDDGLGDLFTIGISMPIRMVQYRDSFSWSKYCCCLFPIDLSRMILEMNNVHELFHQNMTEFLQTDIDGSLDFLLNAITIESLEKYLKTFYTSPLDIEQISSIWDQLLGTKKRIDTVTEEVWEFANKATIIPFLIFTSMFHQHFKEYRFLESTLELLQQFYRQTKSIAQDYKVFPGDQSKFCLKCLHCGKTITLSESLGKILFIAPMAISHHLKILSSVYVVNDSPSIFKDMLVLFTLARNYLASEKLFDKSIYETAGDDVDVLFYSKNSCTSHDGWIGEYCFCEAIKVNLAESDAKCQTNQPQRSKNQLSNTVSLLCILFENSGCAIESHEKIADEFTELHSLDTRKYLLNGQEEGDDCNNFLLGHGIINEARSDDKEYLQLYESWCLLAYREFCKNLLAILVELILRTYGEKTKIPNRLCKHFCFQDDERIQEYLTKLSKNNNSYLGFSYGTVMNSQNLLSIRG